MQLFFRVNPLSYHPPNIYTLPDLCNLSATGAAEQTSVMWVAHAISYSDVLEVAQNRTAGVGPSSLRA
jgi:hypothetical protein